MHTQKNIGRFWLYGLYMAVALIMLVDFALPGKVYVSEVTHVTKTRRQYYNAAGNYHYSYRVFTKAHSFPVSAEFAETLKEPSQITYTVSILFKEINRYGSPGVKPGNTYSLRWFSGLVLPVVAIAVMGIARTRRKRTGTLIFSIQVFLIANTIFLVY